MQIIYTQIDRDAENVPTFRSYTLRVDPDEYFYPASTVKLPTAALALEKLNRLDRRGLDRDTIMLTGRAEPFQTEADIDETSRTGLPSVGQYIRKILLVSDNDAYNRLYEFLGQAELNESMRAKGFLGTRIVHRLELVLTPEQNRQTNPVRFLRGDETVYSQPARQSEENYLGSEPVPLGQAEIVAGERVAEPKDFAEKNALPLQDLHDTIKAIMFPGSLPASRRFDLTEDDYAFLRHEMSAYPGESGITDYTDSLRYPDGYVKFLLFGGSEAEIPEGIRVFNKVGDAYGFLTDAAYIVDFDHGIEFMLAATIYTNANGTFNDNDYEYEEVGLPFLKSLGQVIYDFELSRQREYSPDLSELKNLR
ncbi:MAG: serine hydrolase [Pseudomonadota bacterium]